MKDNRKGYYVGDVRPSQLIYTYGVGSIIDLPHISTMILGLDHWDTHDVQELHEERLLASVQKVLGRQVKQLLTPPLSGDTSRPRGDIQHGVPVVPFPRYMRCTLCNRLAPVEQFDWEPDRRRPERSRYVHKNCSKKREGPGPMVIPARFMIACEAGHLDDFPWYDFLHGERACNAELYLEERGATGETTDIWVKCMTCQANRQLLEAFTSKEDEKKRAYTPVCRGRRPHLWDYEKKGCRLEAKPILLSASNSWFPLVLSALSLPKPVLGLDELIEQHWEDWQLVTEQGHIRVFRGRYTLYYADYSDEEIWQAIQKRRGDTVEEREITIADLKVPEWEVLSHPESAPEGPDFKIRQASEFPEEYREQIEKVVLIERLKEVRALTGFTRLESLSDYAEDEKIPRDHIAPISRKPTTWVPASEVRGEGIFIQFNEEAIQRWLERDAVRKHEAHFFGLHTQWRKRRGLPEPEENFPGLSYVLLHTLSHALMRQLTLECGYAAASIRERIYAGAPDGTSMAGILLYTAASDSEGTLGGLVSLGENLEYYLYSALEEMGYCASDPLCAEQIDRSRADERTVHGAACHACLFAPETSCERGNRYLDRSVLVPTITRDDLAFFKQRSQ
ncbi:uncharacterized protein DUF1998 [Thermosporothrix hazakensis]|jgi:hypothetical protein|uniref:Uncharacterized protein DUF1998 n=1 Tax=Thermosporothrix hazakensis TaxID=644383 RepID=A0A326U6B8_THEHA|nr:DUF1998 domain-containing protein [Thermosporothrix hazakensis]PZW28504.1 uncharacterized protein DUF1998 [Thermosporothrix hazakensis]GCE45278.1 hypothetical protein KTH_01470 [Thermosporothrix hazakensis]